MDPDHRLSAHATLPDPARADAIASRALSGAET